MLEIYSSKEKRDFERQMQAEVNSYGISFGLLQKELLRVVLGNKYCDKQNLEKGILEIQSYRQLDSFRQLILNQKNFVGNYILEIVGIFERVYLDSMFDLKPARTKSNQM